MIFSFKTGYGKRVTNVKLDEDVRKKIRAEFEKRAKAIGETLPADFETALGAIDVKSLVNDIGPGL